MEAETAFERGAERGDLRSATNLAALLHARGETDRALDVVRRVDEQGDPGAAFTHGVILHERGQRDAAMVAFRRAVERASGHPDPELHNIAVKATTAIAELKKQSPGSDRGPGR